MTDPATEETRREEVEDPLVRRKRRRLGAAALLLSLPFLALPFSQAISCDTNWSLASVLGLAVVWFVPACFGLYQLNIFGVRSRLVNLLSAAALMAGVGTLLAFASIYIGFARCFTF